MSEQETDDTVEIELEENAEDQKLAKDKMEETPEPEPEPEPEESKSEGKEAAEPGSDEELDEYSQGVQKRIKQLTAKYRQAERDQQEAIRYAQAIQQQNEELQKRLQGLDQGYITEYGNRLEAQAERLKQAYRDAYESGDTDKMFEAQQQLSRLSVEQERHRLAKAKSERMQAQPAPEPDAQQQYYQQPQQPQQPDPDPKAQDWAEKNEWFGQDETMTYAAFGIHRKLVEEEGFDPTSDEYYNEIDRRIRTEFPHKFRSQNTGKSSRVAPGNSSASRGRKSGRRTVKLSPSQVAIAEKLGVPLEEYAKYVKD